MLGTTSHLLLIIAAALASIVGNSLLRLGLKKSGIESLNPAYLLKNVFPVLSQPLVFAGFLVFVIGMIIWMRVLTVVPLSKGYPLFTSFVILFLIGSSILFLREPLSFSRIGGMALIAFGTFLVFTR